MNPSFARRAWVPLRRYVAIVCILSIGVTAIAEVSHSHATLKSSADCTICLAAHHSPGKTATTFQLSFSRPLAITVAAMPNVVTASSVVLPFSLSVRPPPSV